MDLEVDFLVRDQRFKALVEEDDDLGYTAIIIDYPIYVQGDTFT